MNLGQFRNAVRFLTVIPVGSSDDAADPQWLPRSLRFFPVVGALVGLVSGATLLLAGGVWGPALAAVLAVLASVLLTSGFHEDGLADTFDAFGGGWTVEQRLTIMKDSRIGTYGSLALIFDIALRATALAEMPPWTGAAALVASGAAGRITAMPIVGWMKYAGELSSMKVAYAPSRPGTGEICFAAVVVLLATTPLAILAGTRFLLEPFVGLASGAALAIALARWSKRLIGGYTGDVLGAIEQVFEIGFLMGVAAVIRLAI
jgi:adenosylcobinamide-GDP ribazoletransferase